MLAREESLVLHHLERHTTSRFAEVVKACLPGAPQDWGRRVLGNLEWLGYITVYAAADGAPLAVQLTEKGTAYLRRQGIRRRTDDHAARTAARPFGTTG